LRPPLTPPKEGKPHPQPFPCFDKLSNQGKGEKAVRIKTRQKKIRKNEKAD